MSDFVRVAAVEELEPHGQLTRWVDDHDLLIYRLDGEIKVISNVCRHFGGPIGWHKMRDRKFTCLWHNYVYSAEDGGCHTMPKLASRVYSSEVRDGAVWVRLTER